MSDTMTREPIETTATVPPAGWYADPVDSALLRWWGGIAWTEHTRVVVIATAPASVATPANGYRPLVSNYLQHGSSDGGWGGSHVAGSAQPSGNTVPVWLLAFYPMIYIALELAIFFLHPAPPVVLGIGLTVFVLLFLVAGADHSALVRRGLPALSPAWLLLSLPVYLVRRRVVLKRAGVKSNAPGNVFALQVFAAIALSYFVGSALLGAQRDTAAVHQLEAQGSAQLTRLTKADWTVTCPTDAPASTVGAKFLCQASSVTGQKTVIQATVTSPDRFSVTLVGTPTSSVQS